jgi:hypothetical protein
MIESIQTDQQAIDEMLKLLEGKTKFKFNGNTSFGDYLYHILGIFDNEKIAVKYFGKHHQWWHYEFIDIWRFYCAYQKGHAVIK